MLTCAAMARPKEFDRERVLARAIKVFAEHGYEGASTEALLEAMHINRQSLYDTFGTKRELYLEALRTYNAASTARILESLASGTTALDGIERALMTFIDDNCARPNPACLGVSAVCEFGRRDRGIAAAFEDSHRALFDPLVRAFERARSAREIDRDLAPATAARFFLSTLSGVKLSARAGMPVEQLRDIVRLALRALA